MLEDFRDGGWGMFPTLGFGLVLVFAARYAVRPEKRFVPLLASLGILTMTIGALGFVSGLIVSVRGVTRVTPFDPLLALLGAGEALNNIGLALCLISLAALATVTGAWRLSHTATHPANDAYKAT